MLLSFASRTRSFSRITAIITLLGALTATQAASAADQCTTSNNASSNAVLSIGSSGALLASQTLNAIMFTEGQIGVMADRILMTEQQIGLMSNRIVYVTQFSQTNSLQAIYLVTNLNYLGKENNQFRYAGSFFPIFSKPMGW